MSLAAGESVEGDTSITPFGSTFEASRSTASSVDIADRRDLSEDEPPINRTITIEQVSTLHFLLCNAKADPTTISELPAFLLAMLLHP